MKLPLDGSEPLDAIIEQFPRASTWLAHKGVICTECGEVFWGTLDELLTYRKIGEEQKASIIAGLNEHLAAGSSEGNN